MGGRVWLYFSKPLERFGFANYTGLAATLVLAMLLALSNDLSMRRLGGRRWKSLHRLNYALFALVVVHGAVYQWLESRAALVVALFGLIAMAVVALQAAGFRTIRAVARPR
jgi:sulfoxide reductase heme-binding subunit YedZ